MIYAATGHRPNKLGGYSRAVDDKLRRLATSYLASLQATPLEGISGMALGWDMAWAEALLSHSVPLVAAVAFDGVEKKWPTESQARFHSILSKASRVHVVSVGFYSPHLMQVRNKWMVDNCQRLVALWNGTPGGTANCVRYATKVDRDIDNLWSQW